jgi:hypothetical protein
MKKTKPPTTIISNRKTEFDALGTIGEMMKIIIIILTAEDSEFPASILISIEGVYERWKSLLSEMPSLWSALQISFREGVTSLERVRTFFAIHPLKITLL